MDAQEEAEFDQAELAERIAELSSRIVAGCLADERSSFSDPGQMAQWATSVAVEIIRQSVISARVIMETQDDRKDRLDF